MGISEGLRGDCFGGGVHVGRATCEKDGPQGERESGNFARDLISMLQVLKQISPAEAADFGPKLGGYFAAIYLVGEVGMKLLSSVRT